MTITRCLCVLIALLLTCSQSAAKGGGRFGRGEDRYNSQHIESLPPEVREAVIRQCGGTARALHPFAHYADNLQTLVLHYEHFYCGAGGKYCGPSGCLRQVYGSSHGRYRLMRSYHTPEWE